MTFSDINGKTQQNQPKENKRERNRGTIVKEVIEGIGKLIVSGEIPIEKIDQANSQFLSDAIKKEIEEK